MDIKTIKQHLTIKEVLQHYGLQPNRSKMLSCPFHKDKTPSMQVYSKTNTVYCFSSNCKTHGHSLDVIDFIMYMEQGSKHQAIEQAKQLINPAETFEPAQSHQPAGSNKQEAETSNQQPTTTKQQLSRIAVLSKAAQESQASFKKATKAQKYLQARGLNPDGLEAGYMGPEFGKSWNEALQQSSQVLGLHKTSRQGSSVAAFSRCVVFFLKNKESQTVGLYGRSITEKAQHRYLPGPHQGLYPGWPSPKTKKLILTESIIDAATLLQEETIASQYSILALYGSKGLTPDHSEALSQLKELQEIILFFDGDKAGEAATTQISEKLQPIIPGIKITAVATPEGEDINSLLEGHSPEIFGELLKTRTPVFPSVETKNHQEPRARPGENQQPATGNQQPAATLDTSNPDKLLYRTPELRFTIWGGIETSQLHRLKINLHVQLSGSDNHQAIRPYYQDDVNLYSNGQLQRYLKGASEELETSTHLLKQHLIQLKEQLETHRLEQREARRQALQPESNKMSAGEEKQALALLKDQDLIKKTKEAISQTGLVGEEKNGLLLFFLYLTRLFEEPLHAIIFGKSGSGKTWLQSKISECLPEESVRTITSLSENVLYYSPKGSWQHVVLVIEDLDGVYQALLALRELMSKQSITKYTTDKDAKGNNVQKTLTVEGPVSVSGATTKETIYEDNANRSFLLQVNESSEHAEAVMAYQRKARAGMVDTAAREARQQLLKNAQRLLDKTIKVYNPYALDLKLPRAVFKPLRSNEHYLKLIDVIAFYHQKQRPVKTHPDTKERYIEVTLKDIEITNELVRDSLLQKSDELSGEQRQFFEYLKEHVRRQHPDNPRAPFYAKAIRKERRLHPMKLARYLSSLERRGYIKWSGGSKRTGYEYEIIAWEEYQELQQGMSILDKILEDLKAREQTNTKNQQRTQSKPQQKAKK